MRFVFTSQTNAGGKKKSVLRQKDEKSHRIASEGFQTIQAGVGI